MISLMLTSRGQKPHLSRGNFPIGAWGRFPQSARMNKKTILLDRIDERLDALGLSASKASQQAGLNKWFIRDLRRRPESWPSARNLRSLASVLQTAPEYLMGEIPHAMTPEDEQLVRMIGDLPPDLAAALKAVIQALAAQIGTTPSTDR